MQSRNPEYPFGQGFNFSVDSLTSYDYVNGNNVPVVGNNFLLSDGSGFLLSDGTNLLLS